MQAPFRLFAGRALRRRCPQCGRGALFRSYARLLASCPECALVYRREPGGMTGSMYVSAAVTQVFAALLILAIVVGTDWSTRLQLAVSVPLAVLFCALCLPLSMAFWVAVEYATDVGNGEAWVAPQGAARPPGQAGGQGDDAGRGAR